MALVTCTVFTDPACPWSWAAEPALLRARHAFAGRAVWRPVMGGMARELTDPAALALQWLEAAAQTGAPCDARLWLGDRPPRSSFPASLAVCAAREQSAEVGEALLRRLREGFALRREPLDTREALHAVARGVTGLDAARFASALESSAVVEAFGADVEAARSVPAAIADRGRAPFPTLHAAGEGGERWVVDEQRPGPWLEAITAAGAGEPVAAFPDAQAALRAHAHALTAPEVAALTDRPLPLVLRELWTGVAEFRIRAEGTVFVAE